MDNVSRRLFSMIVDLLVPRGLRGRNRRGRHPQQAQRQETVGAGWQHDGSAPEHSRKKAYGLCFVVIGVAILLPGISDGVFCLPYATGLWWPQNSKISPKRFVRKSKPQLAADLVQLTKSWLEPGRRLRVVGDISYTCRMVDAGKNRESAKKIPACLTRGLGHT